MNRFETRSLQDLFNNFVHENDRYNKEDAAATQALIVTEFTNRFNKAMRLLSDAHTDEEAAQIYRQFIKEV